MYLYFYVRKDVDGLEVWLKRVAPFVVWGPQDQAQRFATRQEAIAACRRAGVEPSNDTIVEIPDVATSPRVALRHA